jgi:hypothetical protein
MSRTSNRLICKNVFCAVKIGKKEFNTLGKKIEVSSIQSKGILGDGYEWSIYFEKSKDTPISFRLDFYSFESSQELFLELIVKNESTDPIPISSIEQKRKYRAFIQGYRQFHKKCTPLDSDIEKAVLRGYQQDLVDNPSSLFSLDTVPPTSVTTDDTDRQEMDQLVSFLQDGGVGYMPSKKSGGWVRLMFENWNSLGLFTESWKIDRINQLIRDLQVDIVAGCECQCNWNYVPPRRQFLQLLSPGISTVGVASHNITETINRDQMGGTAIAAVGRLSDVVTEVGCDESGLARWSWIRIGTTARSTRVVCGYLPCKPGKTARGHTVWEQHC